VGDAAGHHRSLSGPAHLRSLRYLRLKTLLTAAVDGQSAPR
jgi:hypothetical protein